MSSSSTNSIEGGSITLSSAKSSMSGSSSGDKRLTRMCKEATRSSNKGYNLIANSCGNSHLRASSGRRATNSSSSNSSNSNSSSSSDRVSSLCLLDRLACDPNWMEQPLL